MVDKRIAGEGACLLAPHSRPTAIRSTTMRRGWVSCSLRGRGATRWQFGSNILESSFGKTLPRGFNKGRYLVRRGVAVLADAIPLKILWRLALEKTLPRGFDKEVYLDLNPDVRQAGIDAAEHYVIYGRREGRHYLQPSDRFTTTAPTNQTIVDIFRNEWSSMLPGLVASPGAADLFHDARIVWMDGILKIQSKTVLELGPLEAAHSFMLQSLGAKSVTAIEANQRAFLKCLCIKEIFELSRVRFHHGDFMKYFETSNERFDVIVASGVLYHMTDPLALLAELVKRTDRIYLWTHIYDHDLVKDRSDRELFSAPLPRMFEGHRYSCSKKLYAGAALGWDGFSGGIDKYAVWLDRKSLLDFFSNSGFETVLDFDHANHPNGPALALCAYRPKSIGL
jgi:SAM-dependent methyltransferase